MTKTEQVDRYLISHYPCSELPGGTQTKVAKLIGCTRALVSLRAIALGMVSHKGMPPVLPSRYCGRCNKPISKRGKSEFCNACTWIELPCNHCGLPVKRRAKWLAWQYNDGRNGYRGLVYCNHTCYGLHIRKSVQPNE